MQWLIDGNNVMGSRPDGWWRDRTGGMQRLLDSLAALDEPATVVFDGRARDLHLPPHVTVRFAAHADDAIAELAAPGTVVVTSDGELAARARAAGARLEGAGAFRARLGD